MRHTPSPWLIRALAASLAALAIPALAQPRVRIAVPGDDTPADARESLSVTLNESLDARKDIETARNMEQQKEWNKAADWYQQVLEKYRTRVVAWKADDGRTFNRYRGIVYQVQESLARWPTEGINVYRARFEGTAAAMLDAAPPDDFNTLKQVLDTYFITEAGKRAGLKLIDLHMEAGEFDAAARVGELLLTLYPQDQLAVERPRILYRTALSHHLCGDDKAATARADELKTKFPGATGTVFGRDVALDESLASLMKVAPSLGQQNLSPDSWPTFSGSFDRSHVSAAQGRMGAKICSTDLPRRTYRGPQANDLRNLAQHEEDEGRTLGVIPVVDGNELFFQDGARVWAVGLDSAIPLPGWAQTYGGDRKGVYQLKNAVAARNQQCTLTVTDNAVLAIMGQSNRLQMIYQQQGMEIPGGGGGGIDAGTRLVCLDRATGAERWKVAMGAIAGDNLKDDERERLRALDLSGSPVVVGDNVFVIGRGGKDVQFENCYVLCFDLATGAYRWSCLVASANSNFNVYGGDPSQTGNTLSHLAYASGRLYVLTNLGALASVDAYNGSIVWLTLYPRDSNVNEPVMNWGMRRGGGPMFNYANLRAWEYNPVFEQEGKLFILPTDGKFLLVFDAADGRELKRIPLDDIQWDNLSDHPRTLAAVSGNVMILVGSHYAYAVDWTRYNPQKDFAANAEADCARASTLGSSPRGNSGNGGVRGRAFVTADSLFVPTDIGLYRIAIKQNPTLDLHIKERYPNKQEWDEKEGPGNVIVTGEHVVLAGKNSVDVYTDMALARAKLDREVAAAPTDPDPRLHYAEVMFAAGQSPVSLDKLKEASQLLGGSDALHPGPPRQRLFNDAITFAQKLAKDQQGETVEAAIEFYDLAARAADLPAEQVNYRLSRARFVRQNVQPDSFEIAVRLYQEILSRPELRTVGVVPENEAQSESRTVVQAALEAEAQIADVIKSHPEAYAPVERKATAAVQTAREESNAGKLLDVAQTYPNAAIAPKAMLMAADMYEQANNPRLAAHVLRQIYRKYGNTADKGQIIEAMARNYLGLPGGFDVAIARLKRAKNFGDTRLSRPLVLPDGSKLENVTFREAVAALERARPQPAAPSLSDVHVPFFPRLTPEDRMAGKRAPKPFLVGQADPHPLVIDNVRAIVPPPAELQEATRADRIAVTLQSHGGNPMLAIFAAGQDKPIGTTDALTDTPRFAVWTTKPAGGAEGGSGGGGKSDLFVWSGSEIVVLDADTAALHWTCTLKSLGPSDIVAAAGMQNVEVANDSVAEAANVDEPQQVFINRRGMMMRRRGGFVMARQVQQPQVNIEVAEAAAGPEQVWQVRPLGDRVIAATTGGRLVCLDIATGKPLWQTRISPRPIERIVCNEVFTVVRVTEDNAVRLIAVDNYNGQVQMVRAFAAETGIVPINLALSPDGMLVWTLPDRLCGKDLYEPDPKKLTFEYPSTPREPGGPANNQQVLNPLYIGCSKPGQLLIRGEQIVALEQAGHFVSIHSLEDGTMLRHRSDKDLVSTLLKTRIPQGGGNQPGTSEITVQLRLVDPYLYILGSRTLQVYNLDRPADDQWFPESDQVKNPNFRAAVPVRDMLMIVGEPGGGGNRQLVGNPAPAYQLQFYSRLKVRDEQGNERESGRIEQVFDVTDPTNVTNWQPADGGIYYLTGDQKLHFLRGSRE
jgi:outer membrane protein assembly factor BamB/tetratricopeptide (TPR) repeat protein